MSYESIDNLQRSLSATVFQHTKDAKKAAGRALGTIVEIITYYILKEWGFTDQILIERPLPEYGNVSISHNVEFSFHPIFSKQTLKDIDERPLTSARLLRYAGGVIPAGSKRKNNKLISKDALLRNACVIAEDNQFVYMASLDEKINSMVNISCLHIKPFAMVECKRVGVEDGCKKGPQTIEKAKQGAYVARMTSSLQKIRDGKGVINGVIYDDEGTPIIKPYSTLLDEIVNNRNDLLKNFILSIGVVSNHGNWFTQENQNKELKVLAQSYDWLLFLTDNGLAQFVSDLLLFPRKGYEAVQSAFVNSYREGKKQNVFTKTMIDYDAHVALTKYFNQNIKVVEGWFNVIAPQESSVDALKDMLNTLRLKKWEEIL